jgi:hypothetical protein
VGQISLIAQQGSRSSRKHLRLWLRRPVEARRDPQAVHSDLGACLDSLSALEWLLEVRETLEWP